MHTLPCVCPPRVKSLFPPVLSKSCNQIQLAFKVWFSRNSSSCCWTPWLGSLTWGSEPSLQWVDFCGLSVLQFVSHPPSSYGIWFYCDCTPPTVSLWLFLCLWMWGIFFGEFQCPPLDDCSAVSCDSGVSQEGVSACPSIPPSWTNLPCTLISVIKIPRSEINRWKQVRILNFNMPCQITFHKQCMSIPVSPHPHRHWCLLQHYIVKRKIQITWSAQVSDTWT